MALDPCISADQDAYVSMKMNSVEASVDGEHMGHTLTYCQARPEEGSVSPSGKSHPRTRLEGWVSLSILGELSWVRFLNSCHFPSTL